MYRAPPQPLTAAVRDVTVTLTGKVWTESVAAHSVTSGQLKVPDRKMTEPMSIIY